MEAFIYLCTHRKAFQDTRFKGNPELTQEQCLDPLTVPKRKRSDSNVLFFHTCNILKDMNVHNDLGPFLLGRGQVATATQEMAAGLPRVAR